MMDSIFSKYDEQISVIEKAKQGLLPIRLPHYDIAILAYPEDTQKRHRFRHILSQACKHGDLPANVTSKDVSPSEIGGLTADEIDDETFARAICDPLEDSHSSYVSVTSFDISKNDLKSWLRSENSWPLPKESLLAKWFQDPRSDLKKPAKGKSEKSRLLWDGAINLAKEMKTQDLKLTLPKIAESNQMNEYLSREYQKLFGKKREDYSIETIIKHLTGKGIAK